jgi:hypothetical protein
MTEQGGGDVAAGCGVFDGFVLFYSRPLRGGRPSSSRDVEKEPGVKGEFQDPADA